MKEYHEKAAGDSSPTDPAGTTEDLPKYMSLARKYGMADMEIGQSSKTAQTIEQEYQAYITAPLSRNVDILKFWEASSIINSI